MITTTTTTTITITTHDHDHDGDGWHRHGIFPHTHRYDLDELDLSGKVSWKTLAVLGLSGGLVPSTSAIIVLLGAIQLNRIAFGGILILAFGIGWRSRSSASASAWWRSATVPSARWRATRSSTARVGGPVRCGCRAVIGMFLVDPRRNRNRRALSRRRT